jgi:hypothetical protein
MIFKMTEPTYTKEDLKITSTDKAKRLAIEPVEVEIEKEVVSTKESVKIMAIVAFGYILFSILPTFLLMKFMDSGFYSAQGISLVLAIALVFAFGLHKEASPEQLVKRDMNRRKK